MTSQYKTWNFNEEELSIFMQDVKATIMNDLIDNELISHETYKEYTTTKFLTLKELSFFSRQWQKIFDYPANNPGSYLFMCTVDNLQFKKGEESQDKKPDLKIIPITNNGKVTE